MPESTGQTLAWPARRSITKTPGFFGEIHFSISVFQHFSFFFRFRMVLVAKEGVANGAPLN
jgi:hypothetical protein